MSNDSLQALPGKIFQFNADRDSIVQDVVAREVAKKAGSESALELAINDAAFHEIARLDGTGSPVLERWRDLYRTLGRRDLAEKTAQYTRLARECTLDIVGNFDPRVYEFATRLVPLGLSWLFRSQKRGPQISSFLSNRLQVTGHIDTLRRLSQKGTVILVPTHSSNLDSVVIGYALHTLGLPPFTYGAGKNLFTNFLLSFFMRNLGAYRVDRRLTYALYKDVLKTYSTVLLERGYHQLFFPGGGRCRSNALESKLKLGLLGTGLAAYINNLKAGKESPKIFVVPATLNYHLVLEAETLIDDQLQRIGKSRYIIEDDESAQARRIWSWATQTAQLDTTMVIQFGEPLDPFGNRVDPDGTSRDARGRAIDIRKYVEVAGEPEHLAQRDAEYTRELGAAITKSYRRNLVVLSTSVVAFALWQLAQAEYPKHDVFQLLRLDEPSFPEERLVAAVGRLQERLKELAAAGGIILGEQVESKTPAQLVERALRIFRAYHTRPLASREGDTIRITDPKLVLYYHNRLTGYGLEEAIARQEVHA